MPRRPRSLEHLLPVHVRQAQIEHDRIDGAAREPREGGGSAGHGMHREAFLAQPALEGSGEGRRVLDQQNVRHPLHVARGKQRSAPQGAW